MHFRPFFRIICQYTKNKDGPQSMNAVQLRNTLLLVLTALVWGCAFVAQSVGAEHVGAFTFLACRSWLAGVTLLPVIALLRARQRRPESAAESPAPQSRRALLTGGIACGCFLFLASSAQQIGVASTTTAKAGFITAMYVIIVPILSLVLGRRVGKKIWLCVAMSVAGLYLLCIAGSLSLSRGDAMVLLCALLFAGHIMTVDHFSPKMDGVQLSCIQFFTTAILATVCMFLFEHPTAAALQSALLPILYAGILSSGVGYTLQIVAQKGLNPTIASMAMSLESVFSALAGWVILGQGLTAREFSGCTLMFAAIILAQLPDRKRSAAPSHDAAQP